jgi:hypothetical protein
LVSQPEHHNPGVTLKRMASHIAEALVEGHQDAAIAVGRKLDGFVRLTGNPLCDDIRHVVAGADQERSEVDRKVLIQLDLHLVVSA